MTHTAYERLRRAAEEGDHQSVLRETERLLAENPGNDAAHELRARGLLALGRLEEAERHAHDAVRLDPDEIRYRELLAEVLSARGAHRDAATEYGDLARNDPAQTAWTLAEAEERLGAAQGSQAVDAARRAVRLEPNNYDAQLALAQAQLQVGNGDAALRAATAAAELRPDTAPAREAVADARWLLDQDAEAFAEFRALSAELSGADRDRVMEKARALYRQRAGLLGRLIAGVPALFRLGLGNGWLHVR